MLKKESPPLELVLEGIKRMSNIRYELFKTFYDRRPIVEHYLDGSVVIHVHVFTSQDAFCILTMHSDDHWMLYDSEKPMFTWVGQVSKELRPIGSFVWLQPLNCCDVVGTHPSKMPELSLELLWGIYNDKLTLLDNALGIKASHLINEEIKGNTQVLDDLAYQSRGSRWSGEIGGCSKAPNGDFSDFTPNINHSLLILQGDSITHNFCEVFNLRPEQVQVFPCPVNLLTRAIKRMHDVYLP